MKLLDKSIFRTLAYADIFDYPLKISEIWKYLISPKKIKKEEFYKEIEKIVRSNKKRIDTEKGFYFFRGRKEILNIRRKRNKWSRKKIRIAKRIASWLKYIPSIKMIAITGSLAMENSGKDDDIDLLIIASKNRLWLTRGLVATFLRLIGFYPRPNKIKNKICPNMFLDEEHLRIPKKERNLFTAHEICQMKLIWERNGIYKKFLKKNKWIKKYMPNGINDKHSISRANIRNFEFLPFLFLEKLSRNAQIWYMRNRKTTEITESGRICFHPRDNKKWILKEYEKRLKKLGI